MKRFRQIYCISFLVFFLTTQSQNLKQDIENINKAYVKANKFSCVMEIKMYENYTSSKVYYSQEGIIRKNGDKTLQTFEDTECLTTPDYAISIDKEEKLIFYLPKKTSFNGFDVAYMMNLDSIGLFCKSYVFNKESTEKASYNFEMNEDYPDYSRIIIVFNPKTSFIEKIVYYCDEDDISKDNEEQRFEKSRVEIVYKNINVNPIFKEIDFNYQKYMFKQGLSFALNPVYKGYELTILKL